MSRVSEGSCAPSPICWYMFANIGMRNITMPMSTTTANEPIMTG